MSTIVDGQAGITFPDSSNQQTVGYTGFRNRIINGGFLIDQRNSGASTTPTADATYTLDRWQVSLSQASKFSIQQNAGSVTPPTGFKNYAGITSLSAYAVLTTDYFMLNQPVEGLNVWDLGWGATGAVPVTLSFWVRSSLAGTFGGAVQNSAQNRSYPYSYTINSANTWEFKTIVIPGDTTGTWLTTNGVGLFVRFALGVGANYSGTAGAWAGSQLFSVTGATSIVGTNAATFYVTGVQVERGSTATQFEFRQFGFEYDLCRRYCEVYGPAIGEATGTFPQQLAQIDVNNRAETFITYYPKRTTPTITFASGTNMFFQTMANTGIAITGYSGTSVGTGLNTSNLFFTVASGITTNSLSAIGYIYLTSSNQVVISAEF